MGLKRLELLLSVLQTGMLPITSQARMGTKRFELLLSPISAECLNHLATRPLKKGYGGFEPPSREPESRIIGH